MPRPTTKKDLLAQSRAQYSALIALIDGYSAADQQRAFKPGQFSKARVLKLKVSVDESHWPKVRWADRSSPHPTHAMQGGELFIVGDAGPELHFPEEAKTEDRV